MATDPVCGMQVNEERATAQDLTRDYQGRTYYFCSPGCKRQFDQNSQRDIGGQQSARQ